MLTLRLSRTGTKKRPVYHLVATDSRSRRDGNFVENLGYYIPNKNIVSFRTDRVAYWVGCGAVVSPIAKRLIKQAKLAPAPAAKPAKVEAQKAETAAS
jgi:small subunit ribosomal protein S16